MSFTDYATELVNDAKLSNETEESLFKLEQVKEVILHRDKSLIPILFPSIIELMTRPSSKIKKFLVKFAAECLYRCPAVVSGFLSLYGYLLESGNSDNIHRAIIVQIARMYDKVAMAVVKSVGGSCESASWASLSHLTNSAIDQFGTTTSESAKLECLKMIEAVCLFGYPASRAVRTDDSSGSGGVKHTVADIPIHHATINRQDIENETDSFHAKLILWITRGSSNGSYSIAVLCALAMLIAKLAVERPSSHRLLGDVKALTHFLTALIKMPGSASMELLQRDNLYRSLFRVLQLGLETGGEEAGKNTNKSHYDKFKSVLETFNAETVSKNVSTVVSDPRKRGRGAAKLATVPVSAPMAPTAVAVKEDDDDADVDETTKQKRLESVLAAVNAREAKIKAQEEGVGARLAGKGSIESASVGLGTEVEFGWEIARFDQTGGANTQLVVAGGSKQEDELALMLGSSVPPQDMNQSKLVSLLVSSDAQPGAMMKSVPNMVNLVEQQYQSIAVYTMEHYLNELASLKMPYCVTEETRMFELFHGIGVKMVLGLCEAMLVPAISDSNGNMEQLQLALNQKKNLSRIGIYMLPSSISSLSGEHVISSIATMAHIAPVLNTVPSAASISETCSSFLVDSWLSVPSFVDIPKPLWVFISALIARQDILVTANTTLVDAQNPKKSRYHQSPAVVVAKTNTENVKNWIDVLALLVGQIHSAEHLWADKYIEGNDGGFAAAETGSLYDDVCLVILSRLLQRRLLRVNYAFDFLQQLPYIPSVCLSYISMLLYMGGKQFDNPLNADANDKSIRQDAASLLGKVILQYDEDLFDLKHRVGGKGRNDKRKTSLGGAGNNHANLKHKEAAIEQALNCLLWCLTTSDEIEIRTVALSTITNNVLPNLKCPNNSVVRSLYVHSLHSAMNVIGISKLKDRVLQQVGQFPSVDGVNVNTVDAETEVPEVSVDTLVDTPGGEGVRDMEVDTSVDVDVVGSLVVEGSKTEQGASSLLLMGEDEAEEDEDEDEIVLPAEQEARPQQGIEDEGVEETYNPYPDFEYNSLLFDAIGVYDMGLMFSSGGGPFIPLRIDHIVSALTGPEISPETESSIMSVVEKYCRMHTHLLFQLALADHNLLISILNLYGCVVHWKQRVVHQLEVVYSPQEDLGDSKKKTASASPPQQLSLLRAEIKVYDAVIASLNENFANTVPAIIRRNLQYLLSTSAESTETSVKNGHVVEDAQRTDMEVEQEAENHELSDAGGMVVEEFLKTVLASTDVYAHGMVYNLLECLYCGADSMSFNSQAAAVGGSASNPLMSHVNRKDYMAVSGYSVPVTERVISYVEAYVERIVTTMEVGWSGDQSRACVDNKLLLPLVANVTTAPVWNAPDKEGKLKGDVGGSVDGASPQSVLNRVAKDGFLTKFKLPLLNGYSRNVILEELLPGILKYFPPASAKTGIVSPNYPPDTAKKAFMQLLKAKQPVISKVELLVFLHQFDFEVYNAQQLPQDNDAGSWMAPPIKLSVMLECIGICLDQLKDLYTPDVLSTVLMQLVATPASASNKDASEKPAATAPPQALMRTALLASSKYDECKRVVFKEVIPALIQMKIWILSPALWDGVAYFIRKFSTQKDAEVTLRCILGLPHSILSGLIESCSPAAKKSTAGANDLRKLLKRLVFTLSAEEKLEAYRGVWAGLARAKPTPSTADTSDTIVDRQEQQESVSEVEEAEKLELEEKYKIMQSL